MNNKKTTCTIMKKRYSLLAAALLCLNLSGLAQINLRFVDAAEAAQLLATEDATTNQWSKFDYEARLGRPGGTKQELIDFISQQARNWSENDKQIMQAAADALNRTINEQHLNLPLPKEIKILKTTMAEEGGAGGYTRKDYIVIEEKVEKFSPATAQYLLAHELFHILTRNNPDFRQRMYTLIGFSIADREFERPADLRDVLITNPDVNRFDSYATFTIDGEKKPCAMVIYSSKPYEGGSFFKYLTIGLVPLKDGKPEQKDGKTQVYPISRASDFFEQVGRNTNYIINPEEILAENFAAVMLDKQQAKTPELYEKIRVELKK